MGLKIVMREASELISAEYNPRTMTEKEDRDLTDSIKRFGFVDPILVNTHRTRQNVVIGGHQRLRIATCLGITSVPCVELSLTEAQERELNVRLNKNTGNWDYDALANFFEQEDLIDWGFTEGDFDLASPPDDEIPEPAAPCYNITVKCANAEAQAVLYQELEGRGYTCTVST